MTSTLRHRGDPADVCRERGWTVGTKLIGDEGYGPTVIEITGIGASKILAKCLGHNGKATGCPENSWVLWCRDWREAKPDEVPVAHELGTVIASQQRPDVSGPVTSGPDSHGAYGIDWNGKTIRIPDPFVP